MANTPQALWRGNGPARAGIGKLFWSILRLLAASWLWGTAIRLAHFQPPLKTVGAILALVSIALFIWALRGLWQGFRILGIKRLAITFLCIYGLVAALNVLTVPNDRPIGERILNQLAHTAMEAVETLTGGIQSIIQAPDELLFAYTGERLPPQAPAGFPTPDPDATPIRAVARSSGSGLTSPSLTTGGYTRVANTGGQPLRARSGPGTTYEVVTRFPEGTRLLVLEGPVLGGEFRWWKVRGEQGEGWCADRWLVGSD